MEVEGWLCKRELWSEKMLLEVWPFMPSRVRHPSHLLFSSFGSWTCWNPSAPAWTWGCWQQNYSGKSPAAIACSPSSSVGFMSVSPLSVSSRGITWIQQPETANHIEQIAVWAAELIYPASSQQHSCWTGGSACYGQSEATCFWFLWRARAIYLSKVFFFPAVVSFGNSFRFCVFFCLFLFFFLCSVADFC